MYVGGGEEVDYEGVAVDGKIVVLLELGLGYSRFWLGTFAALAARRGAIAMVVIHSAMAVPDVDGGRQRAAREPLSPDQLPIVCVSGIDGGQLLHAIGRGDARARLIVESELRT